MATKKTNTAARKRADDGTAAAGAPDIDAIVQQAEDAVAAAETAVSAVDDAVSSMPDASDEVMERAAKLRTRLRAADDQEEPGAGADAGDDAGDDDGAAAASDAAEQKATDEARSAARSFGLTKEVDVLIKMGARSHQLRAFVLKEAIGRSNAKTPATSLKPAERAAVVEDKSPFQRARSAFDKLNGKK